MRETVKIGQRGTLTLPQRLREAFGLSEGMVLIAESRTEGILLRPAQIAPDVETYDVRRKAELLLNNATDENDYKRICDEVRRMGVDPESVPHDRPAA